MPSDDYTIPELPSDEELGIAGMSPDDDPEASPASTPPSRGGTGGGRAGGGGDGGGGNGGREGAGDGARARSGPAPRRPWRGPLTLILLLAGVWLASSWRALPSPVAASAPDTAFASGRAMADVAGIARRPHPPGSFEHLRVRGWLVERLRELGLEPEVQTATTVVRRGGTARAATVRNLLARIPGTDPTGAVLVTAHYDARTVSPGAADDGTGVAAILEAVRALRAGQPLRNDLIVLLTDAEELGLLGARAFVDRHPWMEDVDVVLALEMRGGGGPAIMFETGTENGWVIGALEASGARPYANALSYEVYRRLPNDTDFTPFRDAGVQGLNMAAIGRPHLYHQAYDTPENLNEATLQHHGETVLALIRELGSRELAQVDGPDRVFLRLPVLGIVSYAPVWIHPISLVLVVLAVVAFLLVRRADPRKSAVGGTLLGVLLSLLAVGAAAGVGWLLFGGVQGFHPEYGALHGSAFHREGPYLLALVAFTVAVVALLLAGARRWAHVSELALGVLLLPLALTVVLGFVAPMAAMNLQWPLAAALVGVGVVARRSAAPPGNPGWAILVVLALPILAFMVPLVETLWLAMSLEVAPVLGGLVALALLLLLPLVESLRDPGRVWLPALGGVAGVVLTLTGIAMSAPSPDRPAPSTLVYTMERPASESGEAPTARWLSRPDAGVSWARSRVGSLADSATVDGFLLPGGTWLVEEGPALPLAPPDARVEPAGAGTGDRVRLALLSPSSAEDLAVLLPEEGGARIVAVNGEPVERAATPERPGAGGEGGDAAAGADGAGVRRVVHHGLPDGAVLVDLRIPATTATVELAVVEHHQRPEAVGLGTPFLRPPDLAPNVRNQSDRVVIRTPLTLVRAPEDGGWTLRGPAPRPTGPGPDQGAASPGDTLPPGVLPPDTAPFDSVPPDTLPPGTVAPDTVAGRPVAG